MAISDFDDAGLVCDDIPQCPKCGGPGVLLGVLGILAWYRCRNCGWEFSEPIEQEVEDRRR